MNYKSMRWLFLLFISTSLMAQESTYFDEINAKSDSVIFLNIDPNLEIFLQNRVNEIIKSTTIDGFRINIFIDNSQQSRKKADLIRSKYLRDFSYPIYYEWEAPYSKLYVGNFRTKSEALKAQSKIKSSFPNSPIVPSKIDLPDIDSKKK